MELVKNLKVDSVSRLQPTPLLQVSPADSVAEAVALMRQEGVGCILVSQNERVVGIFTERDLLRRILADGKALTTTMAECMTPNPAVVHPKEPIASAVRRMVEGGYRNLPVVDESGRPLGVLSVRNIMHYLVEHFPATVYNLPPESGIVSHKREGA